MAAAGLEAAMMQKNTTHDPCLQGVLWQRPVWFEKKRGGLKKIKNLRRSLKHGKKYSYSSLAFSVSFYHLPEKAIYLAFNPPFTHICVILNPESATASLHQGWEWPVVNTWTGCTTDGLGLQLRTPQGSCWIHDGSSSRHSPRTEETELTSYCLLSKAKAGMYIRS